MSDPTYALQQRADEYERLARQAAMLEPFTERLFRSAGISEGLRVLDVGCGAGHVAFLASRLVGPSGEVVAVDREAAALEVAEAHARTNGHANVTFVTDDFRTAELPGGPFDAVVGRYVLMYQADPGDAVRHLAHRLRPGGVMAFVEIDLPNDDSRRPPGPWPPSEVVDQLADVIMAVWRATGTETRLGSRLPALLAGAGLEPSPQLATECIAGIGRGWAEGMVGLVRSMEGVIRTHELADFDALQLDTAVDRLVDGVPPPGPVNIGPTYVGSWATLAAPT
jgi:ubiquinone/menaquinone biosynthesis C-methylase UbiE